MVDEYDFSKGQRGKYAKRYESGTNLVILAPDLLKIFPDSRSVDKALRDYLRMSREASKKAS
ncbi:MAG: hypothetical protein M1319_06385 [Chloroflexi bacterium]|nr:hypothetical protein [Chloroflexota bacterium]